MPRSILSLVIVMACAAVAAANDPVAFNQSIRPILADKCFSCHGPDANQREAELRLDQREDAIRDRDGYRVIDPGKPDSSLLLERILNTGDEQMPPADSGKQLSPEEVQLIRNWIQQGAEWQEHWSLLALERPKVPRVQQAPWVRNPIDAFILSQLEQRGLKPSPPADPLTLARRISFDLNGLPPSPKDVAQYSGGTTQSTWNAYADRLIASPHFGERMAMYWLDLVRYADTLGFHGDQERSVSPYRDYVIDAFNENLPFDRFTRENLAGDLLPKPTLQQRVASTYNRLNRASAEGGGQPKEYLAKYAADRVRTTGNVWLGITLGCAECHDHKFDPFTTKDFYSFAAFFADIRELGIVNGANHLEQMPVPTREQQQQIAKLEQQIQAAEKALYARTPDREKLFSDWRKQQIAQRARWRAVEIESFASSTAIAADVNDDQVVTITKGPNPLKNDYTIQGRVQLDQLAAIRLETLADPALPRKGPGRAANGNYVVEQLIVKSAGTAAKWKSATASFSQKGYEVKHLAEGKPRGWAIMPQMGRNHHATLVAESPVMLTDGQLTVKIVQQHGTRHTLGKFRLLASDQVPSSETLLPPEVAKLLDLETPTAQQQQELWKAFVQHASDLAAARKDIEKLRAQLAATQKAMITTLVTVSVKPRQMRVLPRGNWMDDSGEIVLPAVPGSLPQPGDTGTRLTRLDLADWLTDRRNPLVARTFVNRLWMLFFGNGIAPSVDDLGSQGAWPTHPQLLDWLAVEFIESGWNVKHIVRLIVKSNAYQQSSRVSKQLNERDPYNQLYARQTRWRLDAEMVRDNALSVSGLLVNSVGGKSARPYQPAGYWGQLNFPKRKYKHDDNQNQYRRGLYTHWQRTFLHPSLLAFDAPAREECQAKRDRSNTPLQALVLLNDPTYVEAARVFAQRILNESGTEAFSQRIDWAYRQMLSRPARPREIRLLKQLHQQNVERYQAQPEDAQKLLAVGIAPVDSKLNASELAAWAATSRAMFNLHEFLMRY